MIKPTGGMLWQWDTGRQVEIALPPGCTINQVHFANSKSKEALTVAVQEVDGSLVADIPNILLQQPMNISAYGYYADENGGSTKISTVLFVSARPRPEGYVYTETEVLTWTALDKRITDLENAEGVSPEEIAEAVGAYLDENPIEETDPTVPAWAKAAEKPSYTAEEVGALPADTKALPDPHALTFTGAVTGSYDGSVPVTVNIPEGGGGGGFSDDQKFLLLNLLKNAAYTADMSPGFEQLENLLNGNEAIAYTVTNNLTDVTTDNESTTAKLGFAYKATLSVEEGCEINESTLTVYMGGVNITATAYADGVIYIPVVIGEIVITAKAKVDGLLYELAPETVFDGTASIDTGYSVYSMDDSFTIVVDFTPASAYGYVFNEVLQGGTGDRNGLQVLYNNYGWWVWYGSAKNGFSTNGTSPTANHKFVVTGSVSDNGVYIYGRAGENTLDKTWTAANYNYKGKTQNMVLGGHGNNTTGHFTGTIHDFKIYDRILDETEINEYLGVS